MKTNKRSPLIVGVLRLLSPGYGYCFKCGLPWNHCKSKDVYLSESESAFATCCVCWDNSTLEELKSYYTESYIKYWGASKHSLKYVLKCVEEEYIKTKGAHITYVH